MPRDYDDERRPWQCSYFVALLSDSTLSVVLTLMHIHWFFGSRFDALGDRHASVTPRLFNSAPGVLRYGNICQSWLTDQWTVHISQTQNYPC